MTKTDARIDAYIARAADFARPVLNRIRQLVHAACPDAEETLKWSAPFFEHKGILLAALGKNKKAQIAFENFSPSHKREYVEWIIEAKREETRAKHIKTVMAQLTDEKSRYCKYH